MKIINTFSAITLLTVSFSAFGQEQPKTIKKISIHDFYIQTGMLFERNTNATLTDFKILAPQSVLLSNNLTDYSSSSDAFIITGNTMFSAMLGLHFSDKQKTSLKTNPLLRLGITYFSGRALTGSLYKENSKPYDTLTSAQTGQTIYIDSVTLERYGMNYSYEQLRIDGSLIFRTNPGARWTIYSGIGVTAGISINAQTDIYYYIDKHTEQANNANYSSYNGTVTFDREKIRNKNNFGASAFIPLGIDFRIGKKREFWKRLHLFYELKPGINITSISELRTITNASLQHGLGLRVSWD